MAKREATAEQKLEASLYLSGQDVTCGKLKINSTACHGCPDNPAAGKEAADQKKIEARAAELQYVGRLHDAVRMGLAGSDGMSMIDFELLRRYHWRIERARGI